MNTTKNQFPRGQNEEKVKAVIEYDDNQTKDEAIAEDEAILDNSDQTMM